MGIPAIIASAVVGRFISVIYDSFSKHYSAPANTLDDFLKVLSTDFANRVENSVRAAFTDRAFVQIKADVTSAAVSLRTYASTGKADRLQLDIATEKILSARSMLFAEAERITSVKIDKLSKDSNPSHGGKRIFQTICAADSAMSALQAIAALELTILAARAEVYPGLNAEIVRRCEENIQLAKSLSDLFHRAHHSRCRIVKEKEDVHDGMYMSTSYHFVYKFYRDGEVHKEFILKGSYCYGDLVGYKPQKLKIEKELDELFFKTIESECHKSQKRLKKDSGNITEAIRLWEAVKEHFKGAASEGSPMEVSEG